MHSPSIWNVMRKNDTTLLRPPPFAGNFSTSVRIRRANIGTHAPSWPARRIEKRGGPAEPSSKVERALAEPETGSRTSRRRTIARIGKPAPIQREAAAANALCQSIAQQLKFANAPVDPDPPGFRQARPVSRRRNPAIREPVQLGADLGKREPDSLCENDEGDPAQYRPPEAALTRFAVPFGSDQSSLLVEA